MYVSAEIRWFWNEPPADLNTWFCDTTIHDCAVGGGAAREDAYFTDPQTELGIKRRGDGDVEIKGLVDVRTDERVEPFVGPIEIWSKWGAESLTLSDPLILVTKRRRVRQFDTRDQMVREIALDAEERPTDGQHLKEGCNVEYTELSMLGYPLWYTVGIRGIRRLGISGVQLATDHAATGDATSTVSRQWLVHVLPGVAIPASAKKRRNMRWSMRIWSATDA